MSKNRFDKSILNFFTQASAKVENAIDTSAEFLGSKLSKIKYSKKIAEFNLKVMNKYNRLPRIARVALKRMPPVLGAIIVGSNTKGLPWALKFFAHLSGRMFANHVVVSTWKRTNLKMIEPVPLREHTEICRRWTLERDAIKDEALKAKIDDLMGMGLNQETISPIKRRFI